MSLVFTRLGAVVDRLLPQFIHPAVVVTSVPVIVVVGTCPVYLALVPRIGAALAIVSCKLMFFAIIISTPWTTAAEPGAAQFFHVFCIGLIMFLSIVHIEAYESHHSIYDLLVPPIIFLSLLFTSTSRASLSPVYTGLPHAMDSSKDSTSKRRPLPTPGHHHTTSTASIAPDDVPRSPTVGSSSTGTSSSISSLSTSISGSIPASSAASSSQPPALPSRLKNLGSSHTTLWQPQPEILPTYTDSQNSAPFREPELVNNYESSTDDLPALISTDQEGGWDSNWSYNNTYEPFAAWRTPPTFAKIDGRDTEEEDHWWDVKNRLGLRDRPGKGMLPPMLAEELHSSDHTLYSVSFPNVDIEPTSFSPSSKAEPGNASDAPKIQEVQASLPHPEAYYCPKDNGWVILSWGYTDENMPIARSFEASAHDPFPRRIWRNPENCLDATGNETHHFHKYPRAVDASRLPQPFKNDQWDTIETVKQKRRVATAPSELDLDKFTEEDDKMDVDEPEGPLFDLYLCCQCSFYVVRSPEVVSGVVRRQLWNDLIQQKKANPQPGKTPERSVALAMETLLMAIENKLWKGEYRMLRVDRPGFQNKMGWNPTIKQVFETLGFTTDTFDTESGLRPPNTDPTVPQGKQNRLKLLRAWAEISAWTSLYEQSNVSLLQHEHKGYQLWVKIEPARETYQLAIGAHPEQISRTELEHDARIALERLSEYRNFGMTATTYSPKLLAFAYFAQCRCDPMRTVSYYSSLGRLCIHLGQLGVDTELIGQILSSESTRGRISEEEILEAPKTLGFGENNFLAVDYEDADDGFIENAWKSCVKRSWREPQGSTLQTRATEALHVLFRARGSEHLRKVYENAKRGAYMSPDQAYATLELDKSGGDLDDEMLITIYSMRIEESNTSTLREKMRDAMAIIAEHRDSERLRKFLEDGFDPGIILPPTRSDIPRGLNQLGNTCYLNSLLQYFYTIKDLREAVMSMNGLAFKSSEDEKLTDDDLKRHRVGGRLVTRREISRSKKFISLLASLFADLQFSEDVSVTPALELAKLALVTSKDEEEDEDKGGTDSSNDTDATLVEEGGAGVARRPSNAMDVDLPVRSESPVASGEAGSSKSVAKKPPPLPPRKPETSGSEMMFGKQHDVSECMDNCMFQIETALLKFDAMTGTEDDNKTSVVKRLFYGKLRQRLASDDLQSRSSVHEKEDLFSHLPVNVTDDGVDIYDGLSAYFDDVVEFEGKKARMEVTLVDTPPLLQIQLQRVQFNRETMQPYKSQAYVKFGETIYLDRFLDSADPQKKTRGKVIQGDLSKCRERIRELLSHKGGHCTSMLDYTTRFLSSEGRTAGVDDDLLFNLQSQQTQIGNEIDHLRGRIDTLKLELEALWRDCKDAPYELTSVFIHRGSSPSFGHYFFYSRNLPSEPDSWFKYNDSDVSEIRKSEVLADTTGSTANPYLLVFARKGSEVVDTVKRLNANMNLTPIS
ncbi:USP domain-containing protein [Mycena kentingensis (nom. inval.)]|nr:USP domain-containing protein [Mycena kentingensis (nom. inval.)]